MNLLNFVKNGLQTVGNDVYGAAHAVNHSVFHQGPPQAPHPAPQQVISQPHAPQAFVNHGPPSNIGPQARPAPMPVPHTPAPAPMQQLNIAGLRTPQDYQNAFNNFHNLTPDTQTNLIAHAAANGLIDKNKATQYIYQIGKQQNAQVHPQLDTAQRIVQGGINMAKATAQPVSYLYNADIANPTRQLAAQFTGNKQAAANAQQKTNLNLGLGAKGTDFKGGLRTFGSNAAQVALLGAGGAIGKGVEAGVTGLTGALAPKASLEAVNLARLGLHQVSNPLVSNIMKYGTGSGTAGLVNAGLGGSQTAGQKGANLGDVLKSAGVSGAVGAGLGLGGMALADGARVGGKALKANTVPLDTTGKGLISEDGSTIPTIKKALGKGKATETDAPTKPTSARPGEAIPQPTAAAAETGAKLADGSLPKGSIPGTYNWLKEQEAAAAAKSAARTAPRKPNLPTAPTLPKPKKTGLVDKQLSDAQKAQRQVINYAADELRQNNPGRDIHSEIRQAGGISKSDYEDIPASLKNKNGQAMDDLATQLGFNNDAELYNAIHNNQRPMTAAEAKMTAKQQLESGNHPYSNDYKQITDAVQQRQDELSRFPQGTRSQVKVTTKAPVHSDAEFQSLAATAEGSAPKAGNKVIDNGKTPVIRNAEAERAVQDVLKKGGSTDEALNAYRNATGADLQTAVRDVRRVAQESNLGFSGGKNPLEGTVKLPSVQAGDHDQAFLNADFVKQHEQSVGQQALDSFHALSDHDKTLLQNIEKDTVSNVSKGAENPAAFAKAEKDIRTYYDTRHAYDKALGIDVGYRQNYLRQLFQKAEDEAKAAAPEQVKVKNGNKNPGYTKTRTNDTLHTHVGQALERDIAGSSTNHAKLAYAKGLEEAHPGKVNTSGQMVRGDEGNYRQLTNKYGDAIFAEKSVANKINSRSRVQTENRGLQRYDKLNSGIKYLKLSGGAFHALTEAGNFIGQQFDSGAFFKEPAATGKVLKTFFSPKTMDREMVKFRNNGTLDKASLSGLTTMAKDILADADVKLGGKLSKYSGIQALHDATFQREIPYAKLKIFEQKTKGLDVNKPADLAKMRSVARGVNDLFGGMNRDIGGTIRPKEFNVLQRLVLATDFTEGKIRTAIRAVNLTDRSPAAQLAREAVIGKAILFGAIATVAGDATGEFKDMNAKQIALAVGGKLLDPKFKAGGSDWSLPATHVSEFTKPLAPLLKGQTNAGKPAQLSDRLKGLQRYGTNRLAAIPSEALQLVGNKDASGARIYGKDYAANGGKQISKGRTGLNIASGFTPIPVSAAISTGTGKMKLPASVANVAGLRVNQDRSGPQAGQSLKTQTGNNKTQQPTKGIYTVKAKDGSTKFATLQGSNMKSFGNMNDAKTAQAKNMFKYSKQTETTINGQAYHKTASGNVVKGAMPAKTEHTYKLADGSSVKNTDISKQSTANTATLTSARQSGDLNGYIGTAQKQLDTISKQMQDPKLSAAKRQQLANDAQTLNSDMHRYTTYGGFTQPKGTTAVKSIGTLNGARSDYVTNITQAAAKYGVDANAALSVAAMEGLGGGVGDNGSSYGPFQLHVGGALPAGKNQAWAESPEGIDYAMQRIAQVAKGKGGQAAIEAIVNSFERPLNPGNEINGALSIYSGGKASLTPGSTRIASIDSRSSSNGSTKSPTFKTVAIPKIGSNPYKSNSSRQKYKQVALPKLRSSSHASYKTPKMTTNLNAKLRKA